MNLTAREEIMARIRAALPGESTNAGLSHDQIVRSYNRSGALDEAATLHLLIDRLLDYDSEIHQVADESEIAAAIAGSLQKSGETTAIVASQFPAAWLPTGFDIRIDNALPLDAVEATQVVITTCEAAVASTGTIFLVHKGAQGRRVITLLPDHHICIVRRSQVHEVIPEAIKAIAAQGRQAVTTISGPSATSDIEMTRIRGVHGPRRLTVILL